GADRVEKLLGDDEVAEAAAQHFGVALDAGYRLAIGLLDVVFQRHRRRADVAAQFERVLGAVASQIGEVETVADAADEIATGDFQAFLVLEKTQRIFNDLERQAEIRSEERRVGKECRSRWQMYA